jgi:hypothetical protein
VFLRRRRKGKRKPDAPLSRFQAYLEVRQGRPVNPMSPSRRGVIKDEALNRLCDFIRDSLFEYFSRTPVEEIDPLALAQFYRDYLEQAATLPCFVAARRKRYESGDDETASGTSTWISKTCDISLPCLHGLSHSESLPEVYGAGFDEKRRGDHRAIEQEA